MNSRRYRQNRVWRILVDHQKDASQRILKGDYISDSDFLEHRAYYVLTVLIDGLWLDMF